MNDHPIRDLVERLLVPVLVLLSASGPASADPAARQSMAVVETIDLDLAGRRLFEPRLFARLTSHTKALSTTVAQWTRLRDELDDALVAQASGAGADAHMLRKTLQRLETPLVASAAIEKAYGLPGPPSPGSPEAVVPVRVYRARSGATPVLVIVLRWEKIALAGADGHLRLGHVRLFAVRLTDGEILDAATCT